MQQAMREGAVVGEQQQAFDVCVEAAHRVDARAHAGGQQVGDDGTAPRVAHGGDDAARLVEHQIVHGLARGQHAAIERDDVGVGVGESRQLAGHDAVDGDAALEHEALSPPA
jgi:hypothetical protein